MTTLADLTEESTSRYVQAGDVRLHYNEAGSGPPMIVLHGGDLGASGWLNFHHLLPRLASRFHVYLVDLPNYGKSDSVVMAEPNATFCARVVRDMLDALGIDRADIVGSTAVTRAFAIDYPERTKKIVTNGNAASGTTILWPTPSEGSKIVSTVNRNLTFETMKDYCKICLVNQDLVTDEWVRARYESANNPAHLEAKKLSSQVQRDLLAESARIQCPVLVTKGRDDRLGPIDLQLRLLSQIPNVRLVVFGKSGHWCHLDQPDDFAKAIMSFLED